MSLAFDTTPRNAFVALARLGYAARGVVYLLVAAIALGIVAARAEPSSKGAVVALVSQPFGRLLLGIVTVGLLGHVLWRLAQAFLNADRQEHDAKGFSTRAAMFVSAATHASLAFGAAQTALGTGGGGGGDQDSVVAWIMQQPFGRWLAHIAGIAVLGAGAAQIWRGLSGQFEKRIDLPSDHARWMRPLCAFGLAARGAVFLVTGGFLILAAWTVEPERAAGVSDALDWIRGLPFGAALYAATALGFAAFAAYSFIQAVYRRVPVPDVPDLS